MIVTQQGVFKKDYLTHFAPHVRIVISTSSSGHQVFPDGWDDADDGPSGPWDICALLTIEYEARVMLRGIEFNLVLIIILLLHLPSVYRDSVHLTTM